MTYTNPQEARQDEELTADLLDEIELLGGPRFRRMEERADGRDLMDAYDLLGHTDTTVSHSNVTQMASTIIRERMVWMAQLREDGQYENFAAYYLEDE